jgi:hypothetical protein
VILSHAACDVQGDHALAWLVAVQEARQSPMRSPKCIRSKKRLHVEQVLKLYKDGWAIARAPSIPRPSKRLNSVGIITLATASSCANDGVIAATVVTVSRGTSFS